MSDGFCVHHEFVESADGLRGKYVYTKRNIFTCEEHKHTADYSDYRAKNKRTITRNLAPLTALPKYSKGDNPRYRFKKETARGKVNPIKTEDAKGRQHLYKITKYGIKEIKL